MELSGFGPLSRSEGRYYCYSMQINFSQSDASNFVAATLCKDIFSNGVVNFNYLLKQYTKEDFD